MRHRIVAAYAIVLCGLAAACDGSTPTDIALAPGIHTDRLVYEAERRPGNPLFPLYAFSIVATYTNPTASPVKLWSCGSVTPRWFLRLVEGAAGEASAYNPAWTLAACPDHENHIIVGPRQTRMDTIWIEGPTVSYHDREPSGLEGGFRLEDSASICTWGGTCVAAPESLRVSKTFEIVIVE